MLETNKDLSAPLPFSCRSVRSAMGRCFITSPAMLPKRSCFRGTFWSVLKSWILCLPMQGDKFQQLKNPNQTKPGEKSQFCKLCCYAATMVTRDRRSGVWGFTKLPHRGVFFWREGEVVAEIAEVGLHDILFVLFQLIHPHALKGCSVF